MGGVYYLPAARNLEDASGDEDLLAVMNAAGEPDGSDRAVAADVRRQRRDSGRTFAVEKLAIALRSSTTCTALVAVTPTVTMCSV